MMFEKVVHLQIVLPTLLDLYNLKLKQPYNIQLGERRSIFNKI